jgi:peptidoglycan hydrolase-like protein with peptidoglycan-binding domain
MAQQPTLGTGDTGEWVTYLQQLLDYHQVGGGFDTGNYCDATAQAVSTLQEQHGLPATGQCDEATWTALAGESSPESESEEDPPADIAVSVQVEVAAPDEAHTLDQLDDLPGNAQVS